MASSADSHALASDSSRAAKKAGEAAAWNLSASAAVPVVVEVGNPIIDADSWPALSRLASPLPPPAAAAQASPKIARPPSTGVVMSPISLDNPDALGANPDNEASMRNPAARRALMMPAGDALKKSTPSPELSPVNVPNARNNGGDHHQNGRFNSHPHGRGGNYGGGNRRSNGGSGGRRGNEHNGVFDGQRRGGVRRDGHGPARLQRGHQPTYIRTPPPLSVVAGVPPLPPPFISPAIPQTPSYGAPMGFHDMTQHVYYFMAHPSEGMPFVPYPASPQAIFIDPVQKELMEQIDYYFSDDNLCKDTYLRGHMDDQGWVPLSLIAGFRKVKKLTNNIQFIMETVMLSAIVEVQGDKIRRRGTWEHWLLPKTSYFTESSSGSMSPVASNIDSLTSQFQTIGLEGATYYNSMQRTSHAPLTRSSTSVSLEGPHAIGLQSNGSGSLFGPDVAKKLMRSDTF